MQKRETWTYDCGKLINQSLKIELGQMLQESKGKNLMNMCLFNCASLFDRKQSDLALSVVVYVTKACEEMPSFVSLTKVTMQKKSVDWTVCLFSFFCTFTFSSVHTQV